MGHRVIALTRAGRTIRGAVVETRLRKFELKSVHTFELMPAGGQDVPPEGENTSPTTLETVATGLNRVLVPGLSTSDSVVVSFPGESSFVRRLTFPFRDRAKIAEVLPIELAGTLPTGLDVELHIAFEKAGEDGGDVVAVGVRTDTLARFVDSWKAEGIDPQHVGVEGLELASLIPFVEEDGEHDRNRMFVWIDGGSVEFLVCRGRDVVLSRALSLPSAVLSGGEVGVPFMREVLLSMAAASEAGAALDIVHVAGAGAGVVAAALSEALSLQCVEFDPAASGFPGAQGCQGLDSSMTRVLALATGVAASSGPASLNLRVGQFGAQGAAGLLREKARFFAASLVLFALLGIGWAAVRYAGLVNDRKAIEAELVQYASRILEQDVSDFDSALATVRSGAREEIGLFPTWTGVGTLEKIFKAVVQAGGAGGGGGGSGGEGESGVEIDPAGVQIEPTGVQGEEAGAAALTDSGELMETEVDLGWAMELENIRVEPRQVSFKGEAESIEKVEELIDRLKADPCFSDIVNESTDRIQFQRHQGWLRFSIRMTVDCSAASAPASAAREDGTTESEAAPVEQGGGE